MQNEPMLCVQDLSVRFKTKYGSAAAVNHVSFSLKKGEKLGLVGESGSGKSVTSKSIIRLLPTPPAQITGSIRLNGEELLTKTERQMCRVRGNQISMIFQEPMTALDPMYTIEEQICESLRFHTDLSRSDMHKVALAMLKKVKIPRAEQILQDYPHHLSGGMLQRVMIAIALINNPRLLIADEPTTALDVTIQTQILELLKKLNREHGMAILFISHNLPVVQKLCTRVAVMQGGHLVETGLVQDIFQNPRQEYTRRLIAAIPTRNRKLT